MRQACLDFSDEFESIHLPITGDSKSSLGRFRFSLSLSKNLFRGFLLGFQEGVIMSALPPLFKNVPKNYEAQFYSNYEWCLNPLLTLKEILARLRDEIWHYESLRLDWQRQECKLNISLLACAISFDIQDYLAWHPWTLATVGKEFPLLGTVLRPVLSLLNLPHILQRQLWDHSLVAWVKRWDQCLDKICEILIDDAEPTDEQWNHLKVTLIDALDYAKIPKHLLKRRMRIPEGYRDQDMAHQDALKLVKQFLDFQPEFERNGEICIIGVRTAGAFFAPIAKAYLVPERKPLLSLQNNML